MIIKKRKTKKREMKEMFFERKLEVHIGKKELIDFIYVIIKEVNMEKKS
jgi:hypothetical protein